MTATAEQLDITTLAVETVDKIGESAALKIEAMAAEFKRKSNADTDRIVNNMLGLAMKIREQGQAASEHMRAHCERSNDVGETMRDLSARIAPKPKPIIAGNDDGARIPRFLESGPRTTLAELDAPGVAGDGALR